MSRKESLEGA